MLEHVFFYGTLTDPTILETLLGRRRRVVSAQVAGYCRVKLRGLGYSFAVADRDAMLRGILISDLSTSDIEKLDKYEGLATGLFERIEVDVVPEDGGAPVRGYMYVGGERLRRRVKTPPGKG